LVNLSKVRVILNTKRILRKFHSERKAKNHSRKRKRAKKGFRKAKETHLGQSIARMKKVKIENLHIRDRRNILMEQKVTSKVVQLMRMSNQNALQVN
jgi:hypothetical protein